MPELLTNQKAAKALGIKLGRLHSWRRRGAPCTEGHFPARGHHGGGSPGPGWNLAKLREWLREEGLVDKNDVILQNQRNRGYSKRGTATPPAAPRPAPAPAPPETKLEATEGLAKLALARLLKAFAWSCQQPGVPALLYDELDDAGIETLNQEALDIITALASEDSTRDYQWQIICDGLPELLKQPPLPTAGPPPPPAATPAPAPPVPDSEVLPLPGPDPASRISIPELAKLQQKLLAAMTNLDFRIRITTEPAKI